MKAKNHLTEIKRRFLRTKGRFTMIEGLFVAVKRLFVLVAGMMFCVMSLSAQNKDLTLIKNNNYWVKVDAGTFIMGCTEGEKECYPDEQPKHEVQLSTYYIGKYEVTVKEYRIYCQKTGKKMPKEPSYGWHDDYPIVGVSWDDAVEYAKYYGCRLPTEAEWEFAARGGNQSKGYAFSGSDDWNEVGWSYENADKTPHPVGQKKPNELGIYDMSGNVWEWCYDNYEMFYYATCERSNPKGPAKGMGKVNRGGGFSFDYSLMNVHHRRCSALETKGTGTGFRLVKTVPKVRK